jgi:hypothetical protein
MNCVQFNILIKKLNILPNVEILRKILKHNLNNMFAGFPWILH